MRFLRILPSFIAIGFIILVGPVVHADHPNAGSVTLSSLMEEAIKNNIEIKESEKQYEASFASRKQAIAPYLPEVGVEGGYQNSKFDAETSSGSFGYGRATINLYRGGKDQAELNARSEEEKLQKIR